MNIYDPQNKNIIKAIKFCLNWGSDMRLLSVDYKVSKELYKVRVFDPQFGGRTTIRLEEKFVRSAINWILAGKKSLWCKDAQKKL